jgi:hypothetical protein
MAIQRAGNPGIFVAAGIDAALVLVFVLIGRASHSEGLLGTLNTWWPFLGGLAIGWLVMRAWRGPQRIVWTGIGIWLGAVGGGMLLRVLSGQGVRPSFVIVATIVLGLFLLGWRGIAILLRRVRARRRARTGTPLPL